jgi:hypothetical protein
VATYDDQNLLPAFADSGRGGGMNLIERILNQCGEESLLLVAA